MSEIVKFARLIARQKESGLTVRSFCSNEGIAHPLSITGRKKSEKNPAKITLFR
jgi:hypothetical protein